MSVFSSGPNENLDGLRTRTLVVDDDSGSLEALVPRLERLDHEVRLRSRARLLPEDLDWAEVVVTRLDPATPLSLPEPAPCVVGVHAAPGPEAWDLALASGAVALVPPDADVDRLSDVAFRIAARVPQLRRQRLLRQVVTGLQTKVVLLADEGDRIQLASTGLAMARGEAGERLLGQDVDEVLPQLLGGADLSHELMRVDGTTVAVEGRWLESGEQRVFVGRREAPAGDASTHGAFREDRLKMVLIESAHDINNKVTVLAFASSTLVDDVLELDPHNKDAKRLGRDMNAAIQQILRLNEVLRLFGHTTVSRGSETLDLRELAGHAATHLALERPAAVVPAVPAGPPVRVVGPRNRLVQVVGHVLRNALDAVEGQPEGQVQIELSETAAEAVLCISDSGPGFPFLVPEEALRPWTSGQSGNAHLGLGLFLAEKILLECGGRIELDTGPLGGAAVRLVLPRA
jgi:signal transduction histidine kinase